MKKIAIILTSLVLATCITAPVDTFAAQAGTTATAVSAKAKRKAATKSAPAKVDANVAGIAKLSGKTITFMKDGTIKVKNNLESYGGTYTRQDDVILFQEDEYDVPSFIYEGYLYEGVYNGDGTFTTEGNDAEGNLIDVRKKIAPAEGTRVKSLTWH